MKKWQCTVCGYIHEGEEPPDECPVCGADKEEFVEMSGEESAEQENPEKTPVQVEPVIEATASSKVSRQASNVIFEKISHLILEHNLHPISVHSPNGIIPVALIFLLLTVLFQFTSLESASYYNMIVVLLSMPLVIFTGYVTWQKKYKAATTSVFKIKIAAGIATTLMLSILIIWRTVQPDIITASSPGRWLFLLLTLLTLCAVGIAGHLGGKLVFAVKK